MPYGTYRPRRRYTRRYPRRPRAPPRRSAPRRRMPAVSTAVKKYVKSTISRKSENKISESESSPDWVFSTQVTTPSFIEPSVYDFRSVFYSITQGVGQGQRVGNKISLKRMPYTFFLRNPKRDGTQAAFTVCRLIIGKMKGELDDPTPGYWDTLIQDGNSSIPANNDMKSVYGKINKDLWDIKYDRRFMLRPPPTTFPTDTMPTSQIFKVVTLDIAKYLPKTISYNDAAQAPSNVGLYAFMICADATGATATSYTVDCPVEGWVEYEDL